MRAAIVVYIDGIAASTNIVQTAFIAVIVYALRVFVTTKVS